MFKFAPTYILDCVISKQVTELYSLQSGLESNSQRTQFESVYLPCMGVIKNSRLGVQIFTVEKFLLYHFSWSHTPVFGHILLNISYKMWPKSGVWSHKKFDSKNFSTYFKLMSAGTNISKMFNFKTEDVKYLSQKNECNCIHYTHSNDTPRVPWHKQE